MSVDLAKATALDVQGVALPAFLYGTAWKEDETEACCTAALRAGFRGIDTANQRKHYYEAGVGAAIRPFLAEHGRDALFLQTKFTYARGQDHRLPFDPGASPSDQVRQSFASSLEHLGVSRLDATLLHGPETREGLSAVDWAVWRTLEALHREGATRLIGVSNVSPDQLRALLDGAQVAPAFVQSRCYAAMGWDADVRAICTAHGVVYQGFSLLTANRAVWNDKRVGAIARRLGVLPAQVIFRFALHLGVLPLTGTSDEAHMAADLRSGAIELTAADLALLQSLSRSG